MTAPVDLGRGMSRAALDAAHGWAMARYHACDVCPERCGVDRHAGELGVCGLGAGARVYKEYLHLGEERCLVPSHAIYLAGCNFRCAFCSDDRAVRTPLAVGVEVPPEALARRIAERRAQGATNVNFVGGLPDVNVLYALEVLRACPDDTHVVWNTNAWTTAEAVEKLTGVVGTWLIDLKFGSDRCALKLAGPRAYLETAHARLAECAASPANVIVRHLLMPGHLACCTLPVIAHVARRHPDVPLNLMTGYRPYRMGRGAGAMAGLVPDAEQVAAARALAAAGLRHPMVDGVALDGAVASEWAARAPRSEGAPEDDAAGERRRA
ncbi:MAG: radical SAM protein [Myxococcales bacterium]|nr:radical SAM protein [Myxococcales bacterium]MCB9731538.1 radical SAM protein [Deltaproteobacteria bacterium]